MSDDLQHNRKKHIEMPVIRSLTLVIVGVLLCATCNRLSDGKSAFASESLRPDVLPVMLNKDLPFRYPPALYAEKAQGNVTLRLYVDTDGQVVSDSTRIAESSKILPLDSAAVKGSRSLRFIPAKLRGAPMSVSILFPVYFRHPEAPPPAGDTVLKKIQRLPATSNTAVKP